MKPKTIKILYWTITILYALMLLMAGVIETMQVEEGKAIMIHLGYPLYVLIVLGVGKILAAIAIVQPKFHTIKEWAYAGITFNLIGACVARASANDSTGLILSPMIFLTVMFISYFLWKKVEQLKASGVTY